MYTQPSGSAVCDECELRYGPLRKMPCDHCGGNLRVDQGVTAMTAEELSERLTYLARVAENAEDLRVLAWRRHEVHRLYPGMADVDVEWLVNTAADLGVLRQLHRDGCSLELALLILI